MSCKLLVPHTQRAKERKERAAVLFLFLSFEESQCSALITYLLVCILYIIYIE